jgi:hypothetical protein
MQTSYITQLSRLIFFLFHTHYFFVGFAHNSRADQFRRRNLIDTRNLSNRVGSRIIDRLTRGIGEYLLVNN